MRWPRVGDYIGFAPLYQIAQVIGEPRRSDRVVSGLFWLDVEVRWIACGHLKGGPPLCESSVAVQYVEWLEPDEVERRKLAYCLGGEAVLYE